MTSKEVTWNWTEEHQKAFEHVQKSISRETLLVYPNFNKSFVIRTDDTKVRFWALIGKVNQSIAFYSR